MRLLSLRRWPVPRCLAARALIPQQQVAIPPGCYLANTLTLFHSDRISDTHLQSEHHSYTSITIMRTKLPDKIEFKPKKHHGWTGLIILFGFLLPPLGKCALSLSCLSTVISTLPPNGWSIRLWHLVG